MTRKDYNALAAVIATAREDWAGNPDALAAAGALARRLTDVLAADNPRFDRDRFLIAAGVPL